LTGNAEILDELAEQGVAAETLRAEFQKESVARDGLNDAAGTGRGFEEMRIQAGFAKCISADKTGNSTADYQCLDAGRHGVLLLIASSESF
jgi:hypothetical protein